jgi:TPR repeat protein
MMGKFLLLLLISGLYLVPAAPGAASEQVAVKISEEPKPQASLGDSQAQFELGLEYIIGQGVKHNLTEAANLFLKAAEQGHRQAQADLGFMYRKGLGVESDLSKAAFWLQKAAAQGQADSQDWLGELYFKDWAWKKTKLRP